MPKKKAANKKTVQRKAAKPAAKQIPAFLKMLVAQLDSLKQKPRDQRFGSLFALLLKHGRSFKPSPLPNGIRKGRAKNCYANCFNLASADGLTYCEGFALTKQAIPMPHAWLTDGKGNAIDPTWVNMKLPKKAAAHFGIDSVDSVPVEYFGIPFDFKWICGIVASAKRWSVLSNLELTPLLLKDGFPKGAIHE